MPTKGLGVSIHDEDHESRHHDGFKGRQASPMDGAHVRRRATHRSSRVVRAVGYARSAVAW
jgi:hypothetical protein